MTNASTGLSAAPLPVCTPESPRSLEDAVRPLTLESVTIGFPAVQAALSGYSDGPMRIVARRLGATYTLAEVVIDRFLVELKQARRTRRHLGITDEEHPVGGQLMGSQPADFAPAAQRLVEAGFDVIDINFGCPVKTALGGCRGGYHLGQPATALEIVDRVRASVPAEIPVTLKMRRGLDDSPESRDRFFEILDGAFARGVAAVTVHGRTVEQKYVGPSNWDFLRAVKRHAGHRTILGSGDLFDAPACLAMLQQTGVDAVSVARGAIGNPWIFGQIQALARGEALVMPSLVEQARVLAMHRDLCRDADGDEAASSKMRMFGIKFARLHPQAIAVRNAFAQARSLTDWSNVLETWYCSGLPEPGAAGVPGPVSPPVRTESEPS